jgi:hypothetical protein
VLILNNRVAADSILAQDLAGQLRGIRPSAQFSSRTRLGVKVKGFCGSVLMACCRFPQANLPLTSYFEGMGMEMIAKMMVKKIKTPSAISISLDRNGCSRPPFSHSLRNALHSFMQIAFYGHSWKNGPRGQLGPEWSFVPFNDLWVESILNRRSLAGQFQCQASSLATQC